MERGSVLQRLLWAIYEYSGDGEVRRIAKHYGTPTRRSTEGTISELDALLDDDLANLVSFGGRWTCSDWNDFLEFHFKRPRRKSYEDVRAEIERALGGEAESVRTLVERKLGQRDSADVPIKWLVNELGVGLAEHRLTLSAVHAVGERLADAGYDMDPHLPDLLQSPGITAKVTITRHEAMEEDEEYEPPRSESVDVGGADEGEDDDHGGEGVAPRYIRCQGVWQQLESALKEMPCGGSAIWVTYSFSFPEQRIVDFFRERSIAVAVLCRHPRSGVTITKHSYRAWHEAGFLPPLGLVSEVGEDEEDPPGPLHAKALVLRIGKGHVGALGSFNLAYTSLFENTETIDVLRGSDAEQLWNEVSSLLRSPFVEEITEADCSDAPGRAPPRLRKARDVHFVKPPASSDDHFADTVRGPPVEPEPIRPADPKYRPEALGLLKRALDEMMAEWPPGEHGQKGWQLKAFKRLQQRMQAHRSRADVLYLPVGLGKTFIALRWLLDEFDESNIRARKQGIFLTPNEWVARSVSRDVAKVLARALRVARLRRSRCGQSDIAQVAGQCMSVLRPSELAQSPEKRQVIAMAADECHNWSPTRGRRVPKERYQGQLERYRGKRGVKVLGLTATPCRMDHARFDVEGFLSAFRTPDYGDPNPLMSLKSAIEGKLLAPYVRVPLLQGKPQKEIANLVEGEDAVVSMGDYHLLVLRDVWRVLMSYQHQLIREIVQELDKSKRALVFMPPVGEEGDTFVAALGRAVRTLGGGQGAFLDFRDRADTEQSARKMFETFKVAPARTGKPAVLVTVNRFSEGVSINDIDTLVMLRATLSPRVAVQALGRGLRLDPDRPRKVCRVLDAVGFIDRLAHWEKTL